MLILNHVSIGEYPKEAKHDEIGTELGVEAMTADSGAVP
jgi:hypothetical protein